MPRAPLLLGLVVILALSPIAVAERPDPSLPNILIVTVDTLRADRLSSLGYERDTSPNIDALILGGVNFADARTVEPLTNPATCSMFTSLPAHRHGGTRNGLKLRPGLGSLPKTLADHGYRTAAFVGNWTLKDKLSGLGEHFEVYDEVLTKARWFGFIRSEATAEDVTERSLEWIRDHVRKSDRPFLAWMHYVEPHAPYVLQKDFLSVLGERKRNYSKHDRYDTEIAYVDASIGELLLQASELSPPENTLVVFASDHGESLGEHDYWGHGRHLYEPTLRIPMALYWKGKLPATTITAPAGNTDIPPTVLGLLQLPVPEAFEGYDWTAVLAGTPAPHGRTTRFEAHKGAVISKHDSDLARRSGLLEVAVLREGRKEILRTTKNRRLVFDLNEDPAELRPLAPLGSPPTDPLQSWLRIVTTGLKSHDDLPPEPLDDEAIAKLKSLGYVD